MADGTWKPVEDVQIGERIQGRVRVNTVLAYDRLPLASHISGALYEINGEYQNTDDHLTLTRRGWAVLSMENYLRYASPGVDMTGVVFDAEMNLIEMDAEYLDPARVEVYRVGDHIAYLRVGWKPIVSIRRVEPLPGQTVYSLVVDGDGTMQVAGGYTVGGWVSDRKWGSRFKGD